MFLFIFFYRAFTNPIIKSRQDLIAYSVANVSLNKIMYYQNISNAIMFNISFLVTKILALLVFLAIMYNPKGLPEEMTAYNIAFRIEDYLIFNIQVIGLIGIGNFIGNSDIITVNKIWFFIYEFFIFFFFMIFLLILTVIFAKYLLYLLFLLIFALLFWYISLRVNPKISFLSSRFV